MKDEKFLLSVFRPGLNDLAQIEFRSQRLITYLERESKLTTKNPTLLDT